MEIQKDSSVVIEYRIQLADGSFVKGEEEPASLHFIVGYEQVLPALEHQLLGLEPGQQRRFTIAAGEAFGEHHESLVKTRPYADFPDGRGLEPGRWVVATNERSGTQYGYRVMAKTAEAVVLDFNHPLAGKDLHYDVRVMSVRPALREELEYLRPCDFTSEDRS